ncbi:MAG: hypothetical protein ABIN58_11120 [candidate division WOR-3 bacterium]
MAEAAIENRKQELYEAAIIQRAAEHADKNGFERILRELSMPTRPAAEGKRIGCVQAARLSAILSGRLKPVKGAKGGGDSD